MKILTRILKNSCQGPWGSSKILKDPQLSCQDLWGSSKIFKDNLQILPRSLRILCGSYQDLWGSLMFLPKIFKGPLWILPRSLRIFKDPGKEIEDPQGSLRILCSFLPRSWGSSIFLPRSLRIFKDLHRSFAYLTKISEDLQGSSIFFGQDPWGSSIFLPRSLRIVRILCWSDAKILRILNFPAKIFEDHQRPLRILCGSCKDLWGSSVDLEWTFVT